jgi:hypothetical protein
MSSNFLFQKIVMAATMILELFVYERECEPVLPYYNTRLECDNKYAIGKKCLDGDMDSIFFV